MSFHLSSVKTSCLSYDKHSTRQGKPIKKIRLTWLLNALVMNRRLFLCQLAFVVSLLRLLLAVDVLLQFLEIY